MPALRLATGKHMGMMLWWKPFNGPDVVELLDLVAAGNVNARSRPNLSFGTDR